MIRIPEGFAWYFKILTIVASVASLGISSWQYQSSDDDYYGQGSFNDFVCKEWPAKYLRPFYVKDQHGNDYFCGYSAGNTGYRLTLACVSIISLALLVYTQKESGNNPGLCSRLLSQFLVSGLILAWFAALVADCYAIGDAESSCADMFANADCGESSTYGITVALDMICLLPLILCTFCSNAKDGLQEPINSSGQRV